MKQHNILYQLFTISGKNGIQFCTRVVTDDKLNVKSIVYVDSAKAKKVGQAILTDKGKILDKKDFAKITIVDSLGAPYRPAAEDPVKSLKTNVPDAMASEISAALKQLKNNLGSVNSYVRSRLKYSSEQELSEYFSAEQVDAIALSIYNIEEKREGMIIGDQTGVGKGRIAAGIIRYAALNGRIPIFITEKPNLFSDIYRDLADIKTDYLVPFVINENQDSTKIKDKNGNLLFQQTPTIERKNIIVSGKLPQKYNVVLTTYSQFSSKNKTPKHDFLLNIIKNNVVILDESHNAGGDIDTSNTARFFYNSLKEAQGVVFLSATFAKRPTNMPIYASKTAIRRSNISAFRLIDIVERGGIPLQEVLSTNLAAVGQMIRREHSFAGIEVNYITLNEEGARKYGVSNNAEKHQQQANSVTKIIQKIILFQQEELEDYLNELNKKLAEAQETISLRKGTKNLGFKSTPIFSKLFNIINQLLFSIKAEDTAKRAIQRLKEGKKPVIAFASTMGTFLDEIEKDSNVYLSFSNVLRKALEATLRFTKTDALNNAVPVIIKPEKLSREARNAYYDCLRSIEELDIDLSISPIDVIKHVITKAGYTVKEVTGRQYEMKFTDSTMLRGSVVSRKKENVSDAFRDFNNNIADVLLINQAGSTGASAHAIVTAQTPLNKVKQRVMIILQPELDINREIQKRGRINRTGQVYLPIYDYLISAIPAEQRLLMMLQRKLKSLDANTTGNQRQSEKLMYSEDFLNKYGDDVVLQLLEENPQLAISLGYRSTVSIPESGLATSVLGRVAVLNCATQKTVYQEIITRYKEYVEHLIENDQYDLELTFIDFKAKTIESELLAMGPKPTGDEIDPFGGNAYIETCEVVLLRKPYTFAEMEAKAHSLNPQLDKANYNEEYRNLISSEDARLYNVSKNSNVIYKLRYDINTYMVGQILYQKDGMPFVFLGIRFPKDKLKTAPSAFSACFAFPDSRQKVEYALSSDEFRQITYYSSYSQEIITPERWKAFCQEYKKNNQTEHVHIITGNILLAMSASKQGRLINYSTRDGEHKKGILMPYDWNRNEKSLHIPLPKILNLLLGDKLSNRSTILTDSEFSISYTLSGDCMIQTDTINVSSVGWLIKDDEILSLINNNEGFIRSKGKWVGFIEKPNIKAFLNRVWDISKTKALLTKSQYNLLVGSKIDIDSEEKEVKIPALINLEIKLFKEYQSAYLGLAGNSSESQATLTPQRAIEIINKNIPIDGKTNYLKHLNILGEEIKKTPSRFFNNADIERPNLISTLKKAGIKREDWLSSGKTLNRSICDVAEWLAMQIINLKNNPQPVPRPAPKQEPRISKSKNDNKVIIAKARMKSLKLKLNLINFQL